MSSKFRTYYMDEAVFNLPYVLDQAEEALVDVDFDTIVGTGFSGGIVIPSLAMRLGKKFALIRKETDDSHHGKGRLLGEIGEKWIFVDDFVASGRTRSRVIEKVQEATCGLKTQFVGEYMYVAFGDTPRFRGFESLERMYGV